MNRGGPAVPYGPAVARPAAGPEGSRPPAPGGLGGPGWPLTALLVLYPLWWALGMGTLAVFVLAVPMALHLWRRRAGIVPPGFGIWVLVFGGGGARTVMLPRNPPGTPPGTPPRRPASR